MICVCFFSAVNQTLFTFRSIYKSRTSIEYTCWLNGEGGLYKFPLFVLLMTFVLIACQEFDQPFSPLFRFTSDWEMMRTSHCFLPKALPPPPISMHRNT